MISKFSGIERTYKNASDFFAVMRGRLLRSAFSNELRQCRSDESIAFTELAPRCDALSAKPPMLQNKSRTFLPFAFRQSGSSSPPGQVHPGLLARQTSHAHLDAVQIADQFFRH